jgi:hypothetical protein
VECENCHNPHEVADGANTVASDPDNIYNAHNYTSDADKAAFCLTCHDDTTALPTYTLSAVGGTWIPHTVTIPVADQALMDKDTYASEAHWTQHDSIGSGEEASCPDCHDQHGSNAPKLLGIFDPATDTNAIGGYTITSNDNTVCRGCHNGASTSYPPNEADRDATSGYLTNGTYPGWTVYNTAYNDTAHTGNGHLDTAAVWPGESYGGGDCKNCHDVHGTANAWDALVTDGGTYGYAQDDLSFCFNCHDGSPAATNVKQFYPVAVGGTNNTDSRSGHRVLSSVAGATLAQNDAVPCYDCHNPHGGSNSEPYMLEANGVNDFNDASTDAGMRRFCFSCHVPSDTSNGWDGSAFSSAVGAEVEGIARTNASYKLKLPSITEHTQANTSNCLDCHGDPHLPTGGVSNGGADCYACHGDYQQYMEDNTGTDTGSNRTTYYHHVLGGSTYDGDESDNFYSSSYPGAGTDVYCLSCHVDHDKFNSSKGSNLRADLSSNPSAANSDYSSTSPYGVCIACHSSARTKDTSNQNSSYGSAQTAAMSGADYNTSAHNYTTSSSFSDATSFNANCVKCHSDFTNETTDYQSASGDQFALHYSAESRILNAFGAAVPATDQLEEGFCFECHSTTGNPNAGSNLDAYGVAGMDDDALAIEGLWTGATSEHPVSSTNGVHAPDEGTSSNWNPSTNRHVECEDCHNPHEATDDITDWPDNTAASTANVRGSSAPAIAGANKGVWGVTISGSSGGDWDGGTNTFGSPSAPSYSRVSEASYQWQLCLKCHSAYGWDSSPPNVSVNLQGQTGGKQTDVGTDFSPDNYAIHPIFDSGKNQPPTSANSQWQSGGSSGRRNIGGTTDTNGLSNTLTDGWLSTSRVVCTDCHNNAVTSGASGPHASDNEWLLAGVDANIKVTTQGDGVLYPNANYATNGQGANFCVNCHRGDVYGSESNSSGTQGISYGDLSRYDHNSANSSCGQANNLSTLLDYSGCLNCHGARKDTNSYSNPANTVVQSGAIHGTSMGDGPGTSYSDPMGYRFRNGASWASQGMGDSSGSGGCQNFTGSGAPSADNYSSCTKHGSRGFTPEYYYARPTS